MLSPAQPGGLAPAGPRVREAHTPAPSRSDPHAEGRGLWPCKAEDESACVALTPSRGLCMMMVLVSCRPASFASDGKPIVQEFFFAFIKYFLKSTFSLRTV